MNSHSIMIRSRGPTLKSRIFNSDFTIKCSQPRLLSVDFPSGPPHNTGRGKEFMTRLASLLALGCLSGFGQYSGTGNTISGVFRALPISAQSRFTPVTGAPYSGEKVTETVQT